MFLHCTLFGVWLPSGVPDFVEPSSTNHPRGGLISQSGAASFPNVKKIAETKIGTYVLTADQCSDTPFYMPTRSLIASPTTRLLDVFHDNQSKAEDCFDEAYRARQVTSPGFCCRSWQTEVRHAITCSSIFKCIHRQSGSRRFSQTLLSNIRLPGFWKSKNSLCMRSAIGSRCFRGSSAISLWLGEGSTHASGTRMV